VNQLGLPPSDKPWAGMTDDAWLLGIHPGVDGLEAGLVRAL
jgi:hypothetical protein